MVKYGRAFISCNKCSQGIGIIIKVDRNSEIWEQIHLGSCDHFKFIINSLTKSTYACFNDEINLDLNAVCINCHNQRSLNPKCSSFCSSSISDIEIKNCCGAQVIFQYEFNSWFDSIKSISYEKSSKLDNENCLVESLINLVKFTFKN